MNSLWFRGVAAAASALLALVMVAINIAFEAAGSVPDVEAFGFLAGHLAALLALYPLAAGVVAARAVRPLARRFPDAEEEVAHLGGRIGFAGAMLYFAVGILNAALRERLGAIPPTGWGLLALYTLLSAQGGRMGAVWMMGRARTVAWREGGG